MLRLLNPNDQPGDIYPIDHERMVKRYNRSGESLFSIEKSILEKLNHPGTVKLLGEYLTKGKDVRMYFVMKRPVHGVKSLRNYLTERE